MPNYFGLHRGHLSKKADEIARRFDCDHINFTEPRGEKRGWFDTESRGEPFDSRIAKEVLEALRIESPRDYERLK